MDVIAVCVSESQQQWSRILSTVQQAGRIAQAMVEYGYFSEREPTVGRSWRP